jgi:hypothetical protein
VDLFDETRYRPVLRKYGLAHQAGRYITQELAQDGSLGLEHALHGLKTSTVPHLNHMAVAVPPYLQHLLHNVSDSRYTEVLHYDRQIVRLLGLPYVFFVSLNYDVLLDRRLNDHRSLSDLHAYIDNGRNWALIKPHGSVNWYHKASEQYEPATPPRDLRWHRTTFDCGPPTATLQELRSAPDWAETTWPTDRYPALALPEGPDDVLVLPDAHKEFLLHSLHSAREIDMLVIGYSGLDRAILDLIADTHCKIRRMTVVSNNQPTAAEVLMRFKAAGLEPLWPNVVDGNFASWSSLAVGVDQRSRRHA